MINHEAGFDLDGVLALCHEELFRRAQALGWLAPHHRGEKFAHWEFEENFPGELTKAHVNEILATPGFFRSLSPCPTMIRAVHSCRAAGLLPRFVTARWEARAAETAGWLAEHGLPTERLAYIRGREKAEYLKTVPVAFFVEDKLKTASMIADNEVCPALLVATPYNEPTATQWVPGLYRMPREWFGSLGRHWVQIRRFLPAKGSGTGG